MANYVCSLPGPMRPGLVITIDGFVPPNSCRFSFNLSNSPTWLGGDVALHLDTRYNENTVVRNSFEMAKGGWQVEERCGPPPPLQRGAHCQCTITVHHDKFQVAFNGQYFCDFRHRIPLCGVNSVIGLNDVQVCNVTFGGC